MNAVNTTLWPFEPEESFILSTGPNPTLQGGGSKSTDQVDLPFLNLDPHDLEGKDNLPDIELRGFLDGVIDSAVSTYKGAGFHGVEFNLSMVDHEIVTRGSATFISELYHTQQVALETVSMHGTDIPVSYEAQSTFGFEGVHFSQAAQFQHLSIASEQGEMFDVYGFDENGDPVLGSYGYYEVVEIAGKLHQNGISDFELSFEMSFELELNETGLYEVFATVSFDGQIDFNDGMSRYYQFEEDMYFPARDLESVEFGPLPDGLFQQMEMFQAHMGDAWDELLSLNDQLEAVFLQLREDEHYDEWDLAGQGLDNPFNFDLPPVDQWV